MPVEKHTHRQHRPFPSAHPVLSGLPSQKHIPAPSRQLSPESPCFAARTSLGLAYGSVGQGTGAVTKLEDESTTEDVNVDGTGAGTKTDDASTEDVNVDG
jgi:hypothetical protein